MPQAFIIMQIGNPDLDHVCSRAIVPALNNAGFDARRVDKHNSGELLKSEIVRFIRESEIIIADLTNERPNVYLEIGYAMGLGKLQNLILTVREDHFLDSPNHRPNSARVHFDLAGYDILTWHAGDLVAFRQELEKRIRRRLSLLAATRPSTSNVWDEAWIDRQRETATAGMKKAGYEGSMEVRSALEQKISADHKQLKQAAFEAPIHTFGWPIGIYMDRDNARPKPRGDGIYAEVLGTHHPSYDYWALQRSGDFYFLGTLFEDESRTGELFFNTRIVRIAEALMYASHLYALLQVDESARVNIAIRHSGLKNRRLTSGASGRRLSVERIAHDDVSETQIRTTLSDLQANLLGHVKEVAAPLFNLFDFFELSDPVYSDIVANFLGGRVT